MRREEPQKVKLLERQLERLAAFVYLARGSVDPDITVIDDPALMCKGEDPQLDRAVTEVMKSLRKNPPVQAKKPKYPLRAGK